MKTKHALFLTLIILFSFGWWASLRAQDIPANYIQNPNMEHELNAIFWYGDWSYEYGSNGIVTYPRAFMSDEAAHSGKWSLSPLPGGWIWVSYPVRGQEQKKFKASFWYKGYFQTYWNFIYRDVGMTFDDLDPTLAEFVGADSAYWDGPGQNALAFAFGGDDHFTEDWTYFEFVWDFPGTIAGWGNTSMWWGPNAPIYIDDLYYGEWYDGHYSGEEPFGFINGDFESQDVNIEWTLNVPSWDMFGVNDFLSPVENHTDAGLQSLRLMDYTVKDTAVAANGKISEVDRNILYQIPAMGAAGKDMELSFWYKGNDASLDLRFYKDYGVSTEAFPLPAGATLLGDSVNTVYDIASVLKFADESTMLVDILANQNFDNAGNIKMPGSSWLWSGSNFYTWDDWTTGVKSDVPHSGSSSFWLPGDPAWTGAEGTFSGMVDNTTYVYSFWYKGKSVFELYLGKSLKYDLVGDPAGIVPAGATADKNKISWALNSDAWTQFVFSYRQGTWLADSSVTSPASLQYDFVGTSVTGDVGYVDDVFVGIVDTWGKPEGSMFTAMLDTLSTTVPPMAARWELPAVANWTEWKLKWTNPDGDIGSTLTMFIDAIMPGIPDLIIPGENEQFDEANAGWTYFDDFNYGIDATGIRKNDLVKHDLYTYPNPATDVLYLSLEIPLKQVMVYNSLGQKVMDENNPAKKINVADLRSGIYLIKVRDQQGTMYKSKFIKE